MSAATLAKRLVLVLAALLLASSCEPAAVTPSASPSPTAAPIGGTLRVVLGSEITTLDPWEATDAATLDVLRQVYETLVDLEPGTFRVVPKLAQRWDVASDGRRYTFTLRPGIRFHDGTPLDAAAVVANFQRLTIARFDLAAQIATVTAQDASTIVFTLRAAYAPFLASLASPSFGIVSPACLAQGSAWARPGSRCASGTGPFRLDAGSWVPGQPLVLTRHLAYWGTDANGHALPSLDGLVFRAVADESSRASAVHTGTADVALDLDPGGAAQLRSDPNISIVQRPTYDASFLGFATSGPFSSPGVRRAVATAIDRAAIVRTVYLGDAKVATQLVPPGLVGFDDSLAEFVKYDTAAAKKTLSDAGQPNGFATDLWYPSASSPTMPDPKRVADAIAADLAKIGIVVTLHADDASRVAEQARAGTLPMWIATRVAARPEADDFLSDVTTDPVVQALLDHARAEMDDSKRAELYKQVTKLIQQPVLRVPLFNAAQPIAASRRVHALVAQPIVGESFAAVWLGR